MTTSQEVATSAAVGAGTHAASATTPGESYPFGLLTQYIHDRLATVLRDEPLLPMFKTSQKGDLYELFLSRIPEQVRQNHNCNCCRSFVNKFGGLVTVSGSSGEIRSVFWDQEDVPAFYDQAVSALREKVENSRITGVHISDERRWGVPVTGPWTHLSATPPSERRHTDRLHTPHQVAAAMKERHKNLSLAIADFPVETSGEALRLLRSKQLASAEAVVGPAEFFYKISKQVGDKKFRLGDALVWLAVSRAPEGWCAPRGHLLGSLMELIQKGMPESEIVRKFNQQADPTRRLRPTEGPSEGSITVAEKLVEKLGIQASLLRRPAYLDEVPLIWSPPPQEESSAPGVFSHLRGSVKTGGSGKVQMLPRANVQAVTWAKFARDVLPEALHIQALLSHGNMGFISLTTAVDSLSPPIIQWDNEENRNPFAWYMYKGGSPAVQWSLIPGTLVDVAGICYQPSMWGSQEKYKHHGSSVILALEGAEDQNDVGMALFPAHLKSDLHGVRSVIEAYSGNAKLARPLRGSALASGLRIGKGSGSETVIAVASELGTSLYRIDRWE